MITSELHSGSPSSQVHTWILSPVFSSQRAPSLHVLPSSHVVLSPHKRLVHPARSPARQRQLLQPSGLHESPSLLARPVTRSLPQPSPCCGRFCGRATTREETEQSTIALLIMIFEDVCVCLCFFEIFVKLAADCWSVAFTSQPAGVRRRDSLDWWETQLRLESNKTRLSSFAAHIG